MDETIATQQDNAYFDLQNTWLISPLQLSLWFRNWQAIVFFEILEQLRSRGKEHLAALEVLHYSPVTGFSREIKLESVENLNHLVARVGDEIDYLKGKKAAFSPFAAVPDQIKHLIHHELPFFWI